MSSLNSILTQPDNEAKIIALDDYVFELKKKVQFNNLTETEKIIYCIERLEKEVNNGGFIQFFFNSTGDYWQETLDALQKIKADKTAGMFKSSLAVFRMGHPYNDRSVRAREVADLSPDKKNFLSELDQNFYQSEEQIGKLLLVYVADHAKDFSP